MCVRVFVRLKERARVPVFEFVCESVCAFERACARTSLCV